MSKNDLPTPSGTFHQPADTALPLAFLMADQRQRWQRGERVFLESYFEQHPEWGESNELLLDLVYHEILVREQRGDEPTLEEYVKRFPHLANDLRMHFEVHTALGAVTPAEEGPIRRPHQRRFLVMRFSSGSASAAWASSTKPAISLSIASSPSR